MRVLTNKNRVYLDYNATTPLAHFLIEEIPKWLKVWGNPSSVHQSGQKARALFWQAKESLSAFLDCHPLELIAVSGGSEANNLALKGLYDKYHSKNPHKNEIILSAVEHPSIKAPIRELEQKGARVHFIPVSQKGELDMDFYESVLSDKTFMVSVMFANNETGIVFPVPKLARMAHRVGALFHCDAVQALGKTPLSLNKMGVDTASFSAHKFYGLKGTGVLYCRKGLLPVSLIQGGPQERRRRAGTENVLGMACFGAVAKKGPEILKNFYDIKHLRDGMEEEILSLIPTAQILGVGVKRLCNTSCVYVPEVEGETLLMNMDIKGYSFSVGSACHSGSLRPSGVLTAMGLSEEQARSSFRVSLGLGIQKKEIQQFVLDLKDSIKRIKSFS